MISRLLSSLLLLFYAAPSFATGVVKLHGKIQHPISDSISVHYSETWLGYQPKKIATKLESDGTFQVTFPLDQKYTNVTIIHGDQSTEIMPQPGDDLYMALDAKNFDSTLNYEGTGAAVANFMAKHMLFSGSTIQFGSKLQDLCVEDPEVFERRVKEALDSEINFMNANGRDLPASFKKSWTAFYQYHVYTIKLDYGLYHAMQKQHSYTVSNIPKEYYTPATKVPAVFDDELLNVKSYRLYILMYYGEILNAKIAIDGTGPKKDDEKETELSFKNMPSRSAELYGAMNIYQNLNGPVSTLETKVSEFRKRYPNSTYLPWIEGKTEMKIAKSKGHTELDFEINTTDGKKLKLSDLKGKVVYLDFWASWCGPCMAEMPNTKKIAEKYAGKDVVFLFVSHDADEAAWKKAMDKIQVNGIHMRDGNGGWDGPVAKQYGITSIPACFLIDKDGKFALDNTPRPGDIVNLSSAIDALIQ